jgi:nucleoside 2-deoxyribosyltransferase
MYRGFKFESATPGKLCPICSAGCFENFDQLGTKLIICLTCGKFRLGPMAELFVTDPRTHERGVSYKLSYFLRSISERALGKRDNSFFPIYEIEEFEAAIKGSEPTVREKLQLLLRYMANLSNYPGDGVRLEPANDYPVICAKNRSEVDFYLRALEESGTISVDAAMGREPNCTLTTGGWQEIERIEQSGADSPNGFIAMWFDPSQNAAKESIESAILEAGYRAIRMDEIEHVNRIDDEIIARIRQSKFLVADLTGQRDGVYFEAGFMLGLGRPVIWICSKADLGDVHFDTRQYNMIDYENTDELKTRLQFRIEAILGKGPVQA